MLESAIGDADRLQLRQKVIQSALRYGAIVPPKVKVIEAPSELTTFKPFSVRELEYEVWDTSRAEQEGIRQQFGALGLIAQGSSASPEAPPANRERRDFPPRDLPRD